MQDLVQQTNSSFEYLYDLLQRIEKRPGMYLGRCSITRLKMLLVGYSLARRELNLPLSQQEKEFDRFQEWIQKRFEIASSQGWDSIILFHSVDEKDALEKFFKLFAEFCTGASASRDEISSL